MTDREIREKIFRAISKAMYDCEGFAIKVDGDYGFVQFWVGHKVVHRFDDPYEALAILLPEHAREILGAYRKGDRVQNIVKHKKVAA